MTQSKIITFTAYRRDNSHGDIIAGAVEERALFAAELDLVVGRPTFAARLYLPQLFHSPTQTWQGRVQQVRRQ